MPTYRVVVAGLEDVQVNVPGCSGDALSLALGPLGLSNFKVDRRSQDGRQWVFQATFKPGGVMAGGPVRSLELSLNSTRT